MSDQPNAGKKAAPPGLPHLPRLAGVIAALLGCVAVIGWKAHWRLAVQLLPSSSPMHFNTALCFVLIGTGLVLLTTRFHRAAPWLGGVVAFFCLLTLSQYFTGRDLGIDTLFSKPYFEANRVYSGRMAVLTAVCFILLGMALALTGGKKTHSIRLPATALLACVVLMIVVVALLGFAFGIEAASGWGAYARMSFNGAIAFFFLGGGLLVWCWQAACAAGLNFSRRILVAGSMTLIAMIFIVSAGNLASLKNSMFWRGHTYQVLNTAAAFLGNLTDTQRGMRGYLLTGSPEALAIYQRATNGAPQQLAHLLFLTRDNPTQQTNVTVLIADLDGVIGYSRELIGTNNRAGLQAAIPLEKTGRGLAVMNRARADLDVFTHEEQQLLVERDSAAAVHFNNSAGLLIFGSAVAVALLVVANVIAGLEMRRRRRAEKIQEDLNVAHTRTLTLQNAILRSANYAFISTTPEGIVTTFNTTAERWLGYNSGEIIGRQTPALWHDPNEIRNRATILSAELGRPVEPGFAAFTAKAELGQVDENEWTFIRKDGSRFPVLLSATALFDPTGKITGFLGVISDITERKAAQEKSAWLATFPELNPNPIVELDVTTGLVLYTNPTTKRLLPDLQSLGVQHPFLTGLGQLRESYPAGADGLRREVTVGKFFFAQILTYLPVSGRLRIYGSDVTTRRKAEAALLESEEKFSKAFQTSPVAFSIAELETGRYTEVNESFCRLYLYTPDQVIGRTSIELGIWKNAADREPFVEALRRDGRVRDLESHKVLRNGETRTLLINAELLELGGKSCIVSLFQDITERKQAEERLRDGEERFRHAFDDAPIGIALVSPAGRWLRVNRALCAMLGYAEAELLNTDFQHITHPADLEKDMESVLQVLDGRLESYQMEKRYFRKTGDVVYAMLSVSLVRNHGGQPLYFVSQIENISERKRAETALQASELQYRSLFENMLEGYAYCRLIYDEEKRPVDFIYLQVNRAFEVHTKLQGVIGRKVTDVMPGIRESVPGFFDLYDKVVQTGEPASYERYADNLQSWFFVSVYSHEPEHFVVVFENITERKVAEAKIVQSLREKEALLREIHHRVKNNMQVISSILQLQTKYIKDPALLDVFKDCQGRIRTMGLIHEKLYRSEGLAQIDFKEYLESLVGLLLRSQTPKGVVVRNELQIAPVNLDIDTAIPLGLIANELVCNCLKHAFTGRISGHMKISLTEVQPGRLQLEVADDGSGLPPGFDPDKTGSLGVRLVKILSGQINGTMGFKSDAGTRFNVTFDLNPSKT